MKRIQLYYALLALFFSVACNKETTNDPVNPGSDPNFTIVANNDGIISSFNRKVEVFGIRIYAVPNVTDANLLHTANVMAQYLDNDEDGTPDNQAIVNRMVAESAFMVLWKKESDLDIEPPNGMQGQDLGNDETHPNFVSGGKTGTFDATLEEVLHLITQNGFAKVYPSIFGEYQGTQIANAMDLARGGLFLSVPSSYPEGAWYSYDDTTCDYGCMVTEYIYWSLTSILGAQENRLDEIGHEWKLNTAAKVEEQDAAVYQLLTNPDYKFPVVLPDGTYRQ